MFNWKNKMYEQSKKKTLNNNNEIRPSLPIINVYYKMDTTAQNQGRNNVISPDHGLFTSISPSDSQPSDNFDPQAKFGHFWRHFGCYDWGEAINI